MKSSSGLALVDEMHPEAVQLPAPGGGNGASRVVALDVALCFGLGFFSYLNIYIYINRYLFTRL